MEKDPEWAKLYHQECYFIQDHVAVVAFHLVVGDLRKKEEALSEASGLGGAGAPPSTRRRHAHTTGGLILEMVDEASRMHLRGEAGAATLRGLEASRRSATSSRPLAATTGSATSSTPCTSRWERCARCDSIRCGVGSLPATLSTTSPDTTPPQGTPFRSLTTPAIIQRGWSTNFRVTARKNEGSATPLVKKKTVHKPPEHCEKKTVRKP